MNEPGSVCDLMSIPSLLKNVIGCAKYWIIIEVEEREFFVCGCRDSSCLSFLLDLHFCSMFLAFWAWGVLLSCYIAERVF